MAAGRIVLSSNMPARDRSDRLVAGALLYVYTNGTTTKASIYTDAALTTPLANPVVANSSGAFVSIWAEAGTAASPTLYTLSLTGPNGESLGNPSVWDDFSPSLDYASDATAFARTLLDDADAGTARATLAAVGTAELAASGGSALVGYISAGTGAVATTLQAKARGQAISTADWGITADSNGTTGNGTDWTTKLQQLVTYARANGRNIWIPAKPGFYIRFTGSIDFTGAQTKMEVIGENNFDSAFFADLISVSNIAAFSNNGAAGARSYVAWKNFRLTGRSDATSRVRGIYSNWGGEFSSFEDVWVIGFYDNFSVANDYYVRFERCLSWSATNDNYAVGRDLSGATGLSNNLSFNACHGTGATGNGLYVYACRALTINGGAYEGNKGANVFLDFVYGGSITGLYNEFDPAGSGNPAAQLRFRNCNGCTVNGYSASAFDSAGNPVIYVDEGCYGIILNGVAIEQQAADLSAVGVLVRASFGVQVNGAYLDGMTTGVRLTEGSRVTISSSNIMAGTPVSSDSGANVLTWNNAIDAQVTASVASINANTATDIIRTTLAKNVIGSVKLSPQATGTHTNLASAAQIIAINAELLSESYRITNILVAVVDAFAGGGGDRDLVIRDSTTVYTTIPAASLQTLNAKGSWGDSVVPFGAGSALVTATQPGLDLYMQYSGGTTDYTTGGVIVVYVEAMRTV